MPRSSRGIPKFAVCGLIALLLVIGVVVVEHLWSFEHGSGGTHDSLRGASERADSASAEEEQPPLAETARPVQSKPKAKKKDSQPKYTCADTPDWKNEFGYTCMGPDSYKSNGWCRNGAVTSGMAWTLGSVYDYPERNCRICGKCGLSAVEIASAESRFTTTTTTAMIVTSRQENLPVATVTTTSTEVETSTTTLLVAAAVTDQSPDAATVQNLRDALSGWVSEVATYQEIVAVHTVVHWFIDQDEKQVSEAIGRMIANDESAGWSTCAVEDEHCKCASGKARYGHTEKTWLTKDGLKDFSCSVKTFGRDVAVGMLKQCQCFIPPTKGSGVEELVEAASVSKRTRSGVRVDDRSEKPPGSVWGQVAGLVAWISSTATFPQLTAMAGVHKWLENGRNTAKTTVSLAQAASRMTGHAKCDDGKFVDGNRCAGYGEYKCRAGCNSQGSSPRTTLASRNELCSAGRPTELLWSCNKALARNPSSEHSHKTAQDVLDATTKEMCGMPKFKDQFDVFLDCEFIDQYLRWTSESSEWMEEAYVTYVAGKKDSNYEWQATNLLRSVDIFSNRPIICIVFGDDFKPPLSWHDLPNVIVYRMLPGMRGVSFNFNKLRAMVSSRVAYGIQLDTDQIIAPGFDHLFAGTRREITDRFPWVMLPVHWMSRDAKKGEPYHEYAFRGWPGKTTMRWGHAHPSWTFWALAFLNDLLYERWQVAVKPGSINVWNLPAAESRGLMEVINQNMKVERKVRYGAFMAEDEDMMNVGLWRDGVTKQWCKYDLEWGLFGMRYDVDKRLYYDNRWYPDGIPVIFTSMHNTKRFEETDWLLSLLAKCARIPAADIKCKQGNYAPGFCKEGSSEERKLRKRPSEYMANMCCCFEPRQDTQIYWAGKWFRTAEEVPMKLPHVKGDRLCLLP